MGSLLNFIVGIVCGGMGGGFEHMIFGIWL
jgi:hypothetical protein